MPLYTGEALILRTYKLGEADRIVVWLTRDRGKKRGVARGARRPRSRFLGALEVMTHARVRYFEREQRELARLDEVEVLRSPLALGSSEVFGCLGYFAELLDEWAPEGDPSEKLFRLGVSTVEALAAGVPPERVTRYFEYWLLRLQGVYPAIATCPRCGAELRTAGAALAPHPPVFVCDRCAPGGTPRLSRDALAFLRAVARRRPDRLGLVPLSPRASQELEAAHARLIEAYLEKPLKSLRVLRALAAR